MPVAIVTHLLSAESGVGTTIPLRLTRVALGCRVVPPLLAPFGQVVVVEDGGNTERDEILLVLGVAFRCIKTGVPPHIHRLEQSPNGFPHPVRESHLVGERPTEQEVVVVSLRGFIDRPFEVVRPSVVQFQLRVVVDSRVGRVFGKLVVLDVEVGAVLCVNADGVFPNTGVQILVGSREWMIRGYLLRSMLEIGW